MSNDQHAGEVVSDGIDGFDDALTSFAVLGAKALIDDERPETGSGSVGQKLREGNTNGEVDAKGLATRIHGVIARAEAIGDADIKCFDRITLFRVALCIERDVH